MTDSGSHQHIPRPRPGSPAAVRVASVAPEIRNLFTTAITTVDGRGTLIEQDRLHAAGYLTHVLELAVDITATDPTATSLATDLRHTLALREFHPEKGFGYLYGYITATADRLGADT